MRMAACAGLARDLARVKKPPRWLRGTNKVATSAVYLGIISY